MNESSTRLITLRHINGGEHTPLLSYTAENNLTVVFPTSYTATVSGGNSGGALPRGSWYDLVHMTMRLTTTGTAGSRTVSVKHYDENDILLHQFDDAVTATTGQANQVGSVANIGIGNAALVGPGDYLVIAEDNDVDADDYIEFVLRLIVHYGANF